MIGVGSSFQFIGDSSTRKLQSFAFLLDFDLFRGALSALWSRSSFFRSDLFLFHLGFHVFALPASSHKIF